jgi:hypothetical protein
MGSDVALPPKPPIGFFTSFPSRWRRWQASDEMNFATDSYHLELPTKALLLSSFTFLFLLLFPENNTLS